MITDNTELLIIDTSADLRTAAEVHVTFSQQGSIVLDKRDVLIEEKKVTVTLYPEDLALFEAGRYIAIEVRFRLSPDGKENVSNTVYRILEDLVNMIGGGGSEVVVDDELSDNSVNPVQNKVLKQALDGKQNDFSDLFTQENEGKVLKISQGGLIADISTPAVPSAVGVYVYTALVATAGANPIYVWTRKENLFTNLDNENF